MNAEFEKIRKKIRLNTLIKSVLLGTSFGLLSVGVLLLVFKLKEIAFLPLYYILIGIGGAVLVFIASFLILNRNEKSIARKLDRDLGFGEKVQTMVEFKDEEGDMIALQRQDADERLGNASPKALKLGRLWQYFVVFALATALFLVAVFIPVKEKEPKPSEPEKGYEMSLYDLTALSNLIEEVRVSSMEQTAKTKVVTELETLLTALKTTDKDATMRTLVIGAIVNVNTVAEEVNTYKEINQLLSTVEQEQIKELSKIIVGLDGETVGDQLAGIREYFTETDVAEKLTDFAAKIQAAFFEQTLVSVEDELYAATLNLAEDLQTVADGMAAQTETWAQDEIDKAFERAETALGDELIQQKANKSTRDRVVKGLMSIFNISASELPFQLEDSTGSYDQTTNDGEEVEGAQGGIGSGEQEFGSQDLIYYPDGPEGGGYVEYGGVFIEEYYPNAKGDSESLPSELRDYIEKYLGTLFDDAKKEEETTNEENQQEGNG